jgi:hypothetical protein
MEQTLGQKRVKADFNPAEDKLVEKLKNKAAEFIDLCEELRSEDMSGERARVIALAQTNVETGCMYAVKANFTK